MEIILILFWAALCQYHLLTQSLSRSSFYQPIIMSDNANSSATQIPTTTTDSVNANVTNSLPSLLIQAAHSAALADGLMSKDRAGATIELGGKKTVMNNNFNNAPPTSVNNNGTTATTSSTGSKAVTGSKSNSNDDGSSGPSSQNNRSAVEAALAMVAVGNSKVKQQEDTRSSMNSNRGAQNYGGRIQAAPSENSEKVGGTNSGSNMGKKEDSDGNGPVAPVDPSAPAPQNKTSSEQQPQRNLTTTAQPKSAGSAAHMLAMAAATHGQTSTKTGDDTKYFSTPVNITSSTATTATASATVIPAVNPNKNPTIHTTVSAAIQIQKQKPTTLAPPAPQSRPQSTTSRPQSSASRPQSSSSTARTTPPVSRTTSAGGNGGSSSASGGGKKKGPPLRRGKWTPEEEAYANRLILEFKSGLLPLTDGTTLRTFLSKLLNCDPMRISKKFVGSNCIGKQVFRRRTADINRLTPDQIQQSRAELSELERRFLERVAQTNRVKSSGVGNNSSGGNSSAAASVAEVSKIKQDEINQAAPPSPPWLRAPNGFKHGTGAASAANSLSSGTVNRTALIGRALLQGNSNLKHSSSKPSLSSSGSAGLLALMELQRRQSQQNLLAQSMGNSQNNLLAAAQNNGNGENGSLSGPALAQIARNASAARMAGLTASGNSMTNLMMKTGLSRDQLSQLVKDRQNSTNSLTGMMGGRQSSLDALMSLDFQSLQSIDNLANLIQTGANPLSRVPKSGMKNWSSEGNTSTNSLAAVAATLNNNSNNNIANLANIRRLASEGRMESLIRSLSSNNVANKGNRSGGSNANFQDLLYSMQNNLNGDRNNSANNLFGQASALDLANMLRTPSSTGLTALRMQDGLAQRNSSVDDFLSLVASGDIPHQDPHLLNVPLQTVLQQQQNKSSASAAAQYLAQQQQLLAQATNNSNSSLSQRIASFGGLNGNSSAASLLSQISQHQQQQRDAKNNESAAAAILAQQQHQARAMAAAAQHQSTASALESLKRKFSLTDMVKESDAQGPTKR